MWHLLDWRDCIEIVFFFIVFHRFIRWLSKDTQENLLGYFFGYCTIFGIAYLMQLSTVCAVMLLYAPVIIMIFILFHEQTIQRNFVTPHHIIAPQKVSADWLGTLISIAIHRINEGFPVTFIIEHTDTITNYIKTSFFIDTEIRTEIILPLIHATSYTPNHMIWVTSHGMLRGTQAYWKHLQNSQEDTLFIDYTTALTAKIDALIFFTNPTSRTFSIIARGTFFERLSGDIVTHMIKKHVSSSHKITRGQYDHTQKKEPFETFL